MKCREILSMLVWYQQKVKDLVGPLDIAVTSEYSFITVTGPDISLRFELPGEPGSVNLPWSDDILKQIDAADDIASLTINCTTGDDYRPGNFSKVLLDTAHIELQQVNYMNSRSLNHKENYSLRSLVFRIPLTGDHKMITEFTDRSSPNNRHCGDKIKAAIDWSPH